MKNRKLKIENQTLNIENDHQNDHQQNDHQQNDHQILILILILILLLIGIEIEIEIEIDHPIDHLKMDPLGPMEARPTCFSWPISDLENS